MSDRVPCTQCQSLILPQTARIYGGWCAVCFKRNRQKAARNRPKELLRDLSVGIRFPFAAVFYWVRLVVRRWRFPHDQKALLQAIAKVYPEPRAAKSYLAGVIKGYFDRSEEFVGWGQNQAHLEGRNDGGKLWRREIAVTDIPTARSFLVGRMRAPEKTAQQQPGQC